MATIQRNFTTKEGRNIELIGAPARVGIWIDGTLYRVVSGLRKARRVAVDHSFRHGPKSPL
jgi:hypothetical protein